MVQKSAICFSEGGLEIEHSKSNIDHINFNFLAVKIEYISLKLFYDEKSKQSLYYDLTWHIKINGKTTYKI